MPRSRFIWIPLALTVALQGLIIADSVAVPARTLKVVVKGLPNGVKANIVVKGPKQGKKHKKYKRVVRKTKKLRHLKPGVYRVKVKPVATVAGVAYPKQRKFKVRVTKHKGFKVKAVYRTPPPPVEPTDPPTEEPTDGPTPPGGDVGDPEIDVSGPPPSPPAGSEVPQSFEDEVGFLFEGDEPRQFDVEPDGLDADRVSVVRGRVTDSGGQPISGARITALDAEEIGHTWSFGDGRFDLAVNGGGTVNVVIEGDGFFTVQRRVRLAPHNYTDLDPIALTAASPQVTTIDLDSTDAEVAHGEVESDSDGARQGNLIFQPGTEASMEMPDGSHVPLSDPHVRITEFTVGTNGEAAMPGDLPPTSAYTYAAEYSVDQSEAAGAVATHFDPPAVSYTDNFLDFPVGTAVPTASYNRRTANWEPSRDGLVITIVDSADGTTDGTVDLDGDDSADDASAIGMTDAEAARLLEIYQGGDSVWRVPVPHFSPWDHNWPFRAPEGARFPDPDNQPQNGSDSDPCPFFGSSTIECQSQVLREDIPLTGTDQALHYRSDRAAGYAARRQVSYFIDAEDIPDLATRVTFSLEVAGAVVDESEYNVPAVAEDIDYVGTWDGNDAFGRPAYGLRPYKLTVAYVYDGVYASGSSGGGGGGGGGAGAGASFALGAGQAIEGSRTRSEILLVQVYRGELDNVAPATDGVGTWSLTDHHSLDTTTGVISWGDGSSSGPAVGLPNTFVTDGKTPCATPGKCFNLTSEYAALGDGAWVVTGRTNSAETRRRLFRVTDDGVGTVFAGTGEQAQNGDGGPAIDAAIGLPGEVAVGPDGSVVFSSWYEETSTGGGAGYWVRRISPDGTISTLAGGGGLSAKNPDNYDFIGPGTDLDFPVIYGLDVGPDGSVFVGAGNTAQAIWQITPDGTTQRVAGGGPVHNADAPALDVEIRSLTDLAVGPQGELYFATGDYLRGYPLMRVTGGFAERLLGRDDVNGGESGGPPISDVEVDPDGTVFLGGKLLHTFTDGRLIHRAGGGLAADCNPTVRGWPATLCSAKSPYPNFAHFELGADGEVMFGGGQYRLIPGTSAGTLGLFAADGEFRVSSPDGASIHVFDSVTGRHLRTVDLLTGVTTKTFGYDGLGRLVSITDRFGAVTGVARNGSGVPVAVVGPEGHETDLVIADGELASVADPIGGQWSFAYNSLGQLDGTSDPRGNSSSYVFDVVGALIEATNRGGGVTALSASRSSAGYMVEVDRDGAVTTFVSSIDASGAAVATGTDPAGASTTITRTVDGEILAEYPDGTTLTQTLAPDGVLGAGVARVREQTITTPGGRSTSAAFESSATLTDSDNPETLTSYTESVTRDGETATVTYDRATRTATTTTAEGRISTVTFTAQGRLASQQVGDLAPIVFAYDTHGRPVSATQGDAVVTYTYGSDGALASQTSPDGEVANWTRDGLRRTTAIEMPDGNTYGATYDGNGNATAVTMPRGGAHGLASDENNRSVSYSEPTGATRTMARDGHGTVTELTYPDGSQRSSSFVSGLFSGWTDGDSTMSVTRLPGLGGGTSGIVGEVARTPDGGTTQSLTYATDGDLVTGLTMAGSVAAQVNYEFGLDMIPDSRTVGGQDPVALDYDADGLISGIADFALTRDALTGLPETFSDGTAEWNYTFDDTGAFDALALTHAAAPAFATDPTRDVMSRTVSRTDTVGGVSVLREFSYDEVGQLIEVGDGVDVLEAFSYDANGNRTARTTAGGTANTTYDTDDRVILSDGVAYSYDPNGFLASRGADTFDYDSDGALLEATVGGVSIDYTYDGLGRRVARTVGSETTAYIYGEPGNDLRVTASVDPLGEITEYFYDDSGSVFALRRGSDWFYVGADQVGSPRVVIEASSGSVVKEVEYSAFGEVIADSAPAFELAIGFAGGLADADSDLLRMGLRDYEPATGRFTARDPMLFAGRGVNLYAYADNNPVDFRDSAGLWKVGFGAFAGIGGKVSLAIADGGISLCSEIGAGVGGGIDFEPRGGLPPDGADILGSFGVGPLGAGIAVPLGGPCAGRPQWDGESVLFDAAGALGAAQWDKQLGTGSHFLKRMVKESLSPTNLSKATGPGSLKPKLNAEASLTFRQCGGTGPGFF